MSRLQSAFAWSILTVWILVVLATVHDPRLVPLATVVTPVMLLPAGWLFADRYFKSREERRDDRRDRDELPTDRPSHQEE